MKQWIRLEMIRFVKSYSILLLFDSNGSALLSFDIVTPDGVKLGLVIRDYCSMSSGALELQNRVAS